MEKPGGATKRKGRLEQGKAVGKGEKESHSGFHPFPCSSFEISFFFLIKFSLCCPANFGSGTSLGVQSA